MSTKLNYKILKQLIDALVLDKNEVYLFKLLEQVSTLYYSKGYSVNAKGVSNVNRKTKKPYPNTRLKNVEKRIMSFTSNYMSSEGWKKEKKYFHVKYVIDGKVFTKPIERIIFYREGV